MQCPTCNGTGTIKAPQTREERIEIVRHLINHTTLSYQEIAERVGRHKSTIGYYVGKYNLREIRNELLTNPETRDVLLETGHIEE